jgi:small subunit ribosomal protein S6
MQHIICKPFEIYHFISNFAHLKKFLLNLNLIFMLNQYETVFICTPVLSEPQVKEAVKKFRDLITSNGGEMIHEEDWGMKKLAYPIQKKSSGFYNLFEFKVDPQVITRLEIEFRRDERVIRFMTVKLDKHAIGYSEKRRRLQKEKTEKEV